MAATLLIPLAQAASLTGVVVDSTGAYIPRAFVELYSRSAKYQAQADDEGVYRFVNLPSGKYTVSFRVVGFKRFTLRSIGLTEGEQKRIPDVPLDVGNGCGSPFRDLVLLATGDSFGRLTGSVSPSAKGVEVTLVCRTFTPCRSTKTDSRGEFTFDMLSSGIYGLNFRRQGFYPENATGYDYTVNAGWESVYIPKALEPCRNGNCDPNLRPPRQPIVCE